MRLIRDHEDKVEADLSQYHHVRYTDRWRFDDQGQRRLTLREIAVRLYDLPERSQVRRLYTGGDPQWGITDYLLADMIHVWTGKAHPARPDPAKVHKTSAGEKQRREQVRRKRIAQREARKRRQVAGRPDERTSAE